MLVFLRGLLKAEVMLRMMLDDDIFKVHKVFVMTQAIFMKLTGKGQKRVIRRINAYHFVPFKGHK